MAGSWKLVLALCLIALPLAIAGGGAAATGWVMPAVRSGCRGRVAECVVNEEDEFELDSESSRRILRATRYISYDALRRNSIPCSRRGASYYNCRPGAQANPYTRGCSAITRCRS
ncbi:rapid alkalinization factor-like [Salvia hispanica]|uniref:rapid alkalinization factor-like n=1 Tax=Salvia hispanica TaxID=49212 RepID=UPI002009B45E|nr:rapid alkalinization factor-like [Salvia hispanica]